LQVKRLFNKRSAPCNWEIQQRKSRHDARNPGSSIKVTLKAKGIVIYDRGHRKTLLQQIAEVGAALYKHQPVGIYAAPEECFGHHSRSGAQFDHLSRNRWINLGRKAG
jgi:hypothetical protein